MSGSSSSPPSSNPPRAAISTLLIGAGFTLSRLAALLPANEALLTAQSAESAKRLAAKFPNVGRLSLDKISGLAALLTHNSGIRSIVDGVPPPDEVRAESIFEAARNRGALFVERGIQRLLYISTTGVFGANDGAWVNESSRPNPKLRRGKARLAVEEGYRETLKEKLTVVRVPAIYGPGRGIGHSLKNGRYRLIEGGTRWTNRIEVSDLARALAAALKIPSLPPVLCLSDGTPAQACDVVDYYCATFKLPKPKSVSEEEAFAAGLETLLSNQRIDSTASWKVLGIEPITKSYKEGAAIEMRK